ncbi:MAG: hypothetical protein LBJ35_05910 [Spirochaetaceae bacterium]|jgi:hypothetical protein|nr:hypothetical protein [Spirochaetaceae bacterium]
MKVLQVILIVLFYAQFAFSQETLRGEARVELEPVYAQFLGAPYPLDSATANLWAVEDAAFALSGMIYGWEFSYDPGERARGLQEVLELNALGKVAPEDARLEITDVGIKDGIFYLYVEYRLSELQANRVSSWKSSSVFTAQAVGYGPLQGYEGVVNRSQIKEGALRDAMKKAIRKKLRAAERNRPRTVTGFIALSKFPVYRMQNGLWAASSEFRIEIKDIIPFAVY